MKTNNCPNCGSLITFNPATNSLTCEYCGGSFRVDSKSTSHTKRPYATNVELQETNMAQYHCNSCGSNINIYKEEFVKRCPNCASLDLEKTSKISYVPDAIVPFQITKEQATANFYEWIKHRKFAPRNLKSLAKLGKISGFYTPIWCFDASTNTSYHGIGIDEDTDKDGTKHTTETPFSGKFANKYTNITISANKQVSNISLSTLGNWGLDTHLKVYSPEYLCGFMASDIDSNVHESYVVFHKHVKDAEYRKARSENSGQYDRIAKFTTETKIYDPKFSYVYLPVYANYYTYKDKKYSCYINGFSGRVTGSAPKAVSKIILLSLIIALLVGIIGLGIYSKILAPIDNSIPSANEFPSYTPTIPSTPGFPTPRIIPDPGFPEITNYSL